MELSLHSGHKPCINLLESNAGQFMRIVKKNIRGFCCYFSSVKVSKDKLTDSFSRL